jgi:hypothetical protein
VAVSRAGGEAIVAVVSIQPVFEIRIAGRGRGAIREQLRDVCAWLAFELLFRFGND